ncbi:MAG TPA: GDP-mannose 4,6-dehydratase [Bryobacteraceae bacterium]
MTTQKILVTGGAGFIGSHLSSHLAERGRRILIVDNFDNLYSPEEKELNLARIQEQNCVEVSRLDICNEESIQRLMQDWRPDAVIHLAALAGVRSSFDRPLAYQQVNGYGTACVLEACRLAKVRKVLFASSSSVYGATPNVPFREDDPDVHPISPYAATKLAGEHLCRSYTAYTDIGVVCLRFFSVYGPRQRPDLVIRKFAELIWRGQPIRVLGDGSCARDYTYVDDVVTAAAAALDLDCRFEVVNVGGAAPIALTEVIAELEIVLGRKAGIVRDAAHPGDVPMTFADLTKARRLLDYSPKVPFREGLKRTVEWNIAQMQAADAAAGLS